MTDFLQQGISSSDQPLSHFIRLAVQSMVQQAIEQEVTDVLGRDRYERQSASNGHRNGYKPGRIRSAECIHRGLPHHPLIDLGVSTLAMRAG